MCIIRGFLLVKQIKCLFAAGVSRLLNLFPSSVADHRTQLTLVTLFFLSFMLHTLGYWTARMYVISTAALICYVFEYLIASQVFHIDWSLVERKDVESSECYFVLPLFLPFFLSAISFDHDQDCKLNFLQNNSCLVEICSQSIHQFWKLLLIVFVRLELSTWETILHLFIDLNLYFFIQPIFNTWVISIRTFVALTNWDILSFIWESETSDGVLHVILHVSFVLLADIDNAKEGGKGEVKKWKEREEER